MKRQRVLISGASGLIGRHLVSFLDANGFQVHRLVRGQQAVKKPTDILWDPATRSIDQSALEGFDAVVNLSGESIAEGRWTAGKKRRILSSRVDATRFLAETLAQVAGRPGVMISASAVGYYGDRGDEILDENAGPGNLFLSEVCSQWEAAANPLANRGVRVVHPRFGVVLSGKGGALAKMLPPFQMGAGGRIGSGRQYMSWIDIEDLGGVVLAMIRTPSLSGAVNAVAPEAVTNEEYTKTLGRVLGRPTIFPMPALAARLVFGEMANELLLASTRATPALLRAAGYSFKFPRLEDSLRNQLPHVSPAKTGIQQ